MLPEYWNSEVTKRVHDLAQALSHASVSTSLPSSHSSSPSTSASPQTVAGAPVELLAVVSPVLPGAPLESAVPVVSPWLADDEDDDDDPPVLLDPSSSPVLLPPPVVLPPVVSTTWNSPNSVLMLQPASSQADAIQAVDRLDLRRASSARGRVRRGGNNVERFMSAPCEARGSLFEAE